MHSCMRIYICMYVSNQNAEQLREAACPRKLSNFASTDLAAAVYAKAHCLHTSLDGKSVKVNFLWCVWIRTWYLRLPQPTVL